MKQCVETDIAIIGGGIAGLWLLNRLRQQGLSVILLESDTLGGDQTHKSQGIIHGGIKYALQGVFTKAAEAIANMPLLWKKCLDGMGEINLSQVPILSTQQYLWSTGSLTSKLAGFFAGFTLKSNISSVQKESYPDIFQHTQFTGHVYSLDEIVIDAHALIRELMKPHRDVIFKVDPMQAHQLQFDENNYLTSLQINAAPMQPLEVKAQKYIFTAGSGNELILNKWANPPVTMQRRPLHMVIMKGKTLPPLFAHCLGKSSTPRITVTTHQTEDDNQVWYLGGHLAEEGVQRTSAEQIDFTRKELQVLFPWQNFEEVSFTSFFVDRAESLQLDGSRPSSCYMKEVGNTIVAWPTKLALAPQLSHEIIACLHSANITPCVADMRALRAWPIPAIAKPIWDQLF